MKVSSQSLAVRIFPLLVLSLLAGLAGTVHAEGVTLEDAEDGAAARWRIYDTSPAGAAVDNLEEGGSRFIAFTSSGTDNGFRLGGTTAAGGGLDIRDKTFASVRLRTDGDFVLYFAVESTDGPRFVYYTPSTRTGPFGNERYVGYGLGTAVTPGEWFTLRRDLQADLERAQPGNRILAVHGVLVRGSLAIDDLALDDSAPPAPSNLPPVADAGPDLAVALGGSVTLDGSASADPDGSIAGFLWTDANGTTLASTATFDWTPPLAGSRTVTLTVTDDSSLAASDTVTVAVAVAEPPATGPLTLEDAEDGAAARWRIYDTSPAGAAVDNLEEGGSRFIAFTSSGTDNGFRLGGTTAVGGGLDIRDKTFASVRLRTDGDFVLYFAVESTDGPRFVYYTPSTRTGPFGNERYVGYGLGTAVTPGEWFTLRRDLRADLERAQPGNRILAVHGVLVRGSLAIDDLALDDSAPPAPSNLPPVADAGPDLAVALGGSVTLDGSASADPDGSIAGFLWTDANGTTLASTATFDWTPPLAGNRTVTLTVTDDSGLAASDTVTVAVAEPPATGPLTLEDAEDGAAARWRIYDTSPAGAAVDNLEEAGSRFIAFTSSGTDNGFRLGGTTAAGGGLDIRDKTFASVRLRTDGDFVLYFAVESTDGPRFVYYTPSTRTGPFGNERYVGYGLGTAVTPGEWFTLRRDLQADLERAQPGNRILAVHGVLVRGSLAIDDLALDDSAPPAPSNLPPVADAGPDLAVALGGSVTLDGSASADPDGSIAGFLWTDANGTTLASTATFDWTPPLAGNRTVTLTVTDDSGLAASDTVTVAVAEPPPGSRLPNLDRYELVFNDEFDGATLDASKWETGLLWGPYYPINNEQQLYVDSLGMHSGFSHSPFEMTGDTLKITATPTSAALEPPPRPPENSPLWQRKHSRYRYNGPTVDPDSGARTPGYRPSDVDYLSGIITSYDSFKMTHGYVEARAKLPGGQGLWPAFWMLPTHYVENVPEIDVMEFLGHQPDRLYNTYHFFDIPAGWQLVSSPSFPVYAADWTEGFHTFGMAWSPRKITWYVNGVETHSITDQSVHPSGRKYTIPTQAMYLIANLAVGGNWPGDADETTPFPATYELDYIRAYKKRTADPIDLAADYQIVFRDEFDGDSLDPEKWNSHFLWGPYLPINDEDQYYVDALQSDADLGYSPFSLSDGILSITARAADDPDGIAPPASLPDLNDPIWSDFREFRQNAAYTPQDFTSGVLTSYDSFKFANGYAEIRARIPKGDGLWPAFWLLNGYYVGQQPEIDILEARGRRPDQAVHNYHRYEPGGVLRSDEYVTTRGTPDLGYADGFHTYGARWRPGRIDWYVDGVREHSYVADDVGYQLMYVILNLAVGGAFDPGATTDPADFPASFDVDYVRVYQEKD